jgi:hypothetical protein
VTLREVALHVTLQYKSILLAIVTVIAPQGLAMAVVSPISSSSIAVFVPPILYLNGDFDRNEIWINSTTSDARLVYAGPSSAINVTGLQPFTFYSVQVKLFNVQFPMQPAVSGYTSVKTLEDGKSGMRKGYVH